LIKTKHEIVEQSAVFCCRDFKGYYVLTDFRGYVPLSETRMF